MRELQEVEGLPRLSSQPAPKLGEILASLCIAAVTHDHRRNDEVT
jgi:hypothetical protein